MRKVATVILYSLKWLACLFIAFVLAANIYTIVQRARGEQFPLVFGYGSAEILSDSMYPTVQKGDVIVLKAQTDYAVDDIIVYKDGDGYVTHRIVELDGGRYVTKGDSPQSDGVTKVSPEAVLGKVYAYVTDLGALMNYFKEPYGLLTLLAVGTLIIFLPTGKKTA